MHSYEIKQLLEIRNDLKKIEMETKKTENMDQKYDEVKDINHRLFDLLLPYLPYEGE